MARTTHFLLNRYWANRGFLDLYILIHYIMPTSNIIICQGTLKVYANNSHSTQKCTDTVLKENRKRLMCQEVFSEGIGRV